MLLKIVKKSPWSPSIKRTRRACDFHASERSLESRGIFRGWRLAKNVFLRKKEVITRLRGFIEGRISFFSRNLIWRVGVVVASRFKALLFGAARGHGTSSRKTLTSRLRSRDTLSLSFSLFEHFRKIRDRLKRGERVLHCDTLNDKFFPRASWSGGGKVCR